MKKLTCARCGEDFRRSLIIAMMVEFGGARTNEEALTHCYDANTDDMLPHDWCKKEEHAIAEARL